jgi:hypothetical protein
METKGTQLVKEIDLKHCHPGDSFRLELGGNPFERRLLIIVEDPHIGLVQLIRQSGLIMKVTVDSNPIEAEKSFVVKVGSANSEDGHICLGNAYSIIKARTLRIGKIRKNSLF